MVYVAYRGTSNVWNWLKNIKYELLNKTDLTLYTEYSNMYDILDAEGKIEVHLGFF